MNERTRPANAFEFFPSPKRVRVVLGGHVVADSRRTGLLRSERMPPIYYFPEQDVNPEALSPARRTRHVPELGEADYYDLRMGTTERSEAAWRITRPTTGWDELTGYIAFDWHAMDGWFEEDLEIFVHPRDPRKRIDTAPSGSEIEVIVDGTTIAHSRRPTLLFETGLPVRYYIPKLDCRLDLFEPSHTLTYCPYKGEARYYSLQLGERREENIAWYYRFPMQEASAVATMAAFYQERVEVLVDGHRV
jgi:uncharacterized protein (DUF427 family)